MIRTYIGEEKDGFNTVNGKYCCNSVVDYDMTNFDEVFQYRKR